MAKKANVTRIAKLELVGGQAKPGPELASLGIDMGGFTKEFNDATRDRQNDIVPVVITAFDDRTFTFVLKTTPSGVLIKKAAEVQKGAHKPSKELAGTITIEKIREIAEYKLEDMNTDDLEQAISMLKGQCRNMGIQVEGDASIINEEAIAQEKAALAAEAKELAAEAAKQEEEASSDDKTENSEEDAE